MRGGRACFEFTTAQEVIRGSTRRKVFTTGDAEGHRVNRWSTLAAGRKAGGQARGEVGGEDARLRGFEVVGGAVVANDLGFGIEQGESGAPVAVPGLADGTGIDHVARVGFQLERD